MFKQNSKKLKVALGMSGGVDSSVAAHLLIEQGYEVIGVFMQCWDARADGCKSDEDRAVAVATATQLGIKFEHLDFRKEYKERVMSYFLNEYKAGRTPNPDVMCNKEIKFGLFFEWAMGRGFDFVATGHYAQIKKPGVFSGPEFKLMRGSDSSKDQSYFLYLLGQKQLSKTLFPVGGMKKTKIRKIAEKLDLPAAKRPDSMGICFIGEVDIKEFLKKHIESKKGDVKSVSGEVVGEHDGAWFYTTGQRHGFKLSKHFGHPMYVVSKDVVANVLVIGKELDAMCSEFFVSDLHCIGADLLAGASKLSCKVRIRNLGSFFDAEVVREGELARVRVRKPIFAAAPGQSAVFYMGNEVVGGGIIV